MFDIRPDSPVPVHEQIAGQVRARVASGALQPGARLAEYRALAQELLTNPQAVARAYRDLEGEGVLRKEPAGGMEVTAGAAVTCRRRLRDAAEKTLREAVAQGLEAGLAEGGGVRAGGQADAAARDPALSPDERSRASTKEVAAPSTSDRGSHRIPD